MGRLMKWMIVLAVIIVVAAPAYAYEVVQMWKCEMSGDTTEVDVEAAAKEWLEGARQMEGGEKFNLTLMFPVAVNATGDVDFHMVVTAPSFTDWGKFWDAYNDDSPASMAEVKYQDIAPCPDSAVWEAVRIDPK